MRRAAIASLTLASLINCSPSVSDQTAGLIGLLLNPEAPATLSAIAMEDSNGAPPSDSLACGDSVTLENDADYGADEAPIPGTLRYYLELQLKYCPISTEIPTIRIPATMQIQLLRPIEVRATLYNDSGEVLKPSVQILGGDSGAQTLSRLTGDGDYSLLYFREANLSVDGILFDKGELAIRVSGGSLYVNRCKFENNRGVWAQNHNAGGAAIRYSGSDGDSLTVRRSSFVNNVDDWFGAAIWSTNGVVELSDNYFGYNIGRGFLPTVDPAAGGAVNVYKAIEARITNNTFYQNQMAPEFDVPEQILTGMGGALALIDVQSSKVLMNGFAENSGFTAGAIAIISDGNGPQAHLIGGNRFLGNIRNFGGSLWSLETFSTRCILPPCRVPVNVQISVRYNYIDQVSLAPPPAWYQIPLTNIQDNLTYVNAFSPVIMRKLGVDAVQRHILSLNAGDGGNDLVPVNAFGGWLFPSADMEWEARSPATADAGPDERRNDDDRTGR